MKVKQRFERKSEEMKTREAQIDAITILPPAEFEWFQNHMLDDYEFISAVADGLHEDSRGIVHALLVLSEAEPHGILVNSEGSAYARYSAYFPYGKDYVTRAVHEVAREIVESHFGQADNGSWVIGFDDIKEHFDLTVTPTNGIGTLLLEELRAQEEIDEIIVSEDQIEISEYLDHVDANVSSGERLMTVMSLIGCNFEDVHLVDRDEEHDLATITDLGPNTLTEAGKKAWSDVLDAKVERVYEGDLGLQVEVSGCRASRLRDFSRMLAGYCSVEEYDRWVNHGRVTGQEQTELERFYHLYKKEWCAVRGIDPADVSEEFGYNGTCYASIDEFEDNEYRSAECMRSILRYSDYRDWRSQNWHQDEYLPITKVEIEKMLESHLLWLNGVDGAKQANFTGYEIKEIDLSGRNLNSVIFGACKLSGVNFSGAEICFADFSATEAIDCDFSYISVDEANFRHAGFINCNWDYIIATHCNMYETDFDQSTMFNGRLRRCCLEGVKLDIPCFADCDVQYDVDESEHEWLTASGLEDGPIQTM